MLRSALAAALALLVAACGSSGVSTRTVTLPSQSSSVRTAPADTGAVLDELPPVPMRGEVTRPTRVQRYRDTIPGPELLVKRISTVRTEDVGCESGIRTEIAFEVTTPYGTMTQVETSCGPVHGEATHIEPRTDPVRSDTAGGTRRHVTGAPKAETRENVRVPEPEPSWWEQRKSEVVSVLALVGAVVVVVILVRYGSSLRMIIPV